ncbi:MAG: BlaI/MecI/CopY family transcriptional regulator [Bacteroidota bacterium]
MQRKDKKPTESELEILRILWDNGPSTVREIHDIISKTKDVGYTTTLKLMQIMTEKKGFLTRAKSGKTHIYSALLTESKAQQGLVDRLLDTAFDGSAMKLVMKALGNRNSSPDELKKIKEFIDQLEKDRDND